MREASINTCVNLGDNSSVVTPNLLIISNPWLDGIDSSMISEDLVYKE